MKRALISVTNKDGVVDFAKGLVELGFEIVSTGGTMKVLQENGVSCIAIDDVTGFPEMLDGRVKTLHPMVHGGLLYRRDLPSHVETIKKHGIHPIDLVCVNLYEFEKALKISEALFSGNISDLTGKELEDGFKGVPHFEIEKQLKLIDFLVEYNICSSKREAREFINAGSISINGNKMSDENIVITDEFSIDNKFIVVRRGKKKYYMGIIKDMK